MRPPGSQPFCRMPRPSLLLKLAALLLLSCATHAPRVGASVLDTQGLGHPSQEPLGPSHQQQQGSYVSAAAAGGASSSADGYGGALTAPIADFDFYLLALFWPPTQVPVDAHGRARHLMHQQEANTGFWTHGLWPTKFVGTTDTCTSEVFKPELLGAFANALLYFLQMPFPTNQPAKLHSFWGHEWQRHGTCSKLAQLPYFMLLYQASVQNNLLQTLSAAKVTPSNSVSYKMQQINAAMAAKYGPAYQPSKAGLWCIKQPNGRVQLAEFRVCLNKTSLAPIDCSRMQAHHGGASFPTPYALHPLDVERGWDRSQLLPSELRTPVPPPVACPLDPATEVWLPDFLDSDAVPHVPWDVVLVMGGLGIVVLCLLTLGYQLLQRWHLVPSLFVAREVQVVHYDLVQLPVKVVCEALDMEWMWSAAPVYAEFVADLPVGMGIKGGIARKLLKEMYGTPEPAGSFDVDVLLLIDDYTPAKRKVARELVAGMKLGGLVLEPQDTEVLTKAWLSEYFITRDVTQNEVLILKVAPSKALFFYTEDAKRDVELQLIRPAVHCLNSEFNMSWEVEDDGTPYTAPQQVCRALVRFLKGHGRDYAFDRATWAHYRRNKLGKTQLFKVLKPFHDNDEKLLAAVDHLIGIGFLSRDEVRKAGGVNMLWGLLLQEINNVVSKFGTRMCLNQLDLDAVERWVDQKKATVAAKKVTLTMRARRTGFVPSDESVIDLGLLAFPHELEEYIDSGPTFSPEAHLTQTANTLVQSLETAKLVSSNYILKSVAEQSGEAAYKVANQAASGAAAKGKGPAAAAGRGGAAKGKAVAASSAGPSKGDALKAELDAEIDKLRGLLDPKAKTQQRMVDEMRTVTRESSKRKNKEYREQIKNQLDRSASASSLDKEGSGHGPGPRAGSITSGITAVQSMGSDMVSHAGTAGTAAGGGGAGSGINWVRSSELKEKMQAVSTLPGSFYQLVPTVDGSETEYVPLVTGKDVPQKTRVEVWRLVNFLIGVMALQKLLLLAAYALMLGGLLFRLCLPRVEAAIFDAFNDLDSGLFQDNLLLWMFLVGCDTCLSLAGGVTMEMFSRLTMRTLFRRFFEHVVFQDLPFFDRLSPGELMARTSGDSLTLRSIVSSTIYQLVEGTTLFMGSVIFLLWSAGPLLLQQPGIVTAFLLVMTLNVVEAGLLGLWLRQCNLKVRQALGRMFGFTLDAFSKIETVACLGLEPRMLIDYSQYARDYFTYAFYMNSSLHAHRAYTYALSALLLAALMWLGGAALFKDLTTVGTLFGLLRYVHWTQTGMKQASNAYARIMAGMGSVERIVELHDRGVFGACHEGGDYPADSQEQKEDEHGEGDEETGAGAAATATAASADGASGTAAVASAAAAAVASAAAAAVASAAAAGAGRKKARRPAGIFRTWSGHQRDQTVDDDAVRQPLLPSLSVTSRSRLWLARPEAAPPADRPDFGALMGGVWLQDVHLTMRSKTDRLLLHDCALELTAGQVAVITGDEFDSKTGLLSLIMLRLIPYKGHIAFQLPDSAIPAAAHLLRVNSRPVPPPSLQLTDAPGPSSRVVQDGGEGWKWATFNFHHDDINRLRARIGIASVGCCGIFRTTVEDNIAIATSQEVTSAEVRDVCRQVGAHDAILQLPDGYATLVGDGSGHPMGQQMALRISLARALIRRPRILLIDNGDLFAEAVGPERLAEALRGVSQAGGCVVINSNQPALFATSNTKVYTMQMGKLIPQSGEPDGPDKGSAEAGGSKGGWFGWGRGGEASGR